MLSINQTKNCNIVQSLAFTSRNCHFSAYLQLSYKKSNNSFSFEEFTLDEKTFSSQKHQIHFPELAQLACSDSSFKQLLIDIRSATF